MNSHSITCLSIRCDLKRPPSRCAQYVHARETLYNMKWHNMNGSRSNTLVNVTSTVNKVSSELCFLPIAGGRVSWHVFY